MHLETVEEALGAGVGTLEGIVVAGVGDNDVGAGESGDVCGLIDGLLKGVEALAGLRGNPYERGMKDEKRRVWYHDTCV